MGFRRILVAAFLLPIFFTACGSDNTNNINFVSSKSWTHPEDLSKDAISLANYGVENPQVAMSNNDNAVISWKQWDGINGLVYLSEYRNGNWNHPTDLTEDAISIAGQDTWSRKIAIDNVGNIIVVWDQSDGSNQRIYMSEYRNGSWTHPTSLISDAISSAGQEASYPEVAMDDAGNAIIVWTEWDGINHQIHMKEYRSGSWGHPMMLDADARRLGWDVASSQVAMDNNGNAIITWVHSDGEVRLFEYRNNAWSQSTIPPSINLFTSNTWPPQVAMDDNDHAIIVLAIQEIDGINSQLYISEYRNGSWSHPTNQPTDAISISGEYAHHPHVTMANSGNAVIVWQQFDGEIEKIYMSEYRDEKWIHPIDITTGAISIPGTDASQPQVAMDNNGNTIIVWQQFDEENERIYMSEYRDGSWEHPTDFTTGAISIAGKDAFRSQVAMNDNGNAIISWLQSDGANSRIYMSEYK